MKAAELFKTPKAILIFLYKHMMIKIYSTARPHTMKAPIFKYLLVEDPFLKRLKSKNYSS